MVLIYNIKHAKDEGVKESNFFGTAWGPFAFLLGEYFWIKDTMYAIDGKRFARHHKKLFIVSLVFSLISGVRWYKSLKK